MVAAHNKNKPYITIHTPTTTSRVLIECNIYIPNYDYDPDMKSVKENFHKQTEQRFHEYEKRMIKNRQIYKEQCDKDIQQIIVKDKMQKSLAEKVEKGCLMCACGLGGVAAIVGLLGTAIVNVLTKDATAAAVNLAIEKGIEAGVKTVITNIKKIPTFTGLSSINWTEFINESSYSTVSGLIKATKSATSSTCSSTSSKLAHCHIISYGETFFGPVVEDGIEATATRIVSVKTIELGKVKATSAHLYSAIGYSVLAILIILLVMIIIYLVLRYRRKKKTNKRLQYTKLLKE
ncbi:rifin [Plasmodium falciparum IGH-CR14]|uniref:Rifin n=1 Tax=Plasmodium falciparum IGH-CR14 TaxID=580059 RepID=A0A0L1I3H4_PLAFA|nr:rifin [Plasmodium falciparum IGH-CR14]